jgi:nitrite reductase/ring-hydroxylating ferredoxin subunit
MCDEVCALHRFKCDADEQGKLRVLGPSRRQFIAQSVLATVVAMLSGGCGDGEIGAVGPPPPTTIDDAFTIRIADFPALQTVGGIARVDGGTSSPLAVSRLGPNTFVALSMVCPHAGYKPINIVTNGFRCPNHGAQFAADGNWTGGQRTKDLQSYPVAYNSGSGTLTIG